MIYLFRAFYLVFIKNVPALQDHSFAVLKVEIQVLD
jgi:hypothetical protein